MRLTLVEQNDGILHLALDGSLDIEGIQEISSKFATLTGANKTHTLIDMSGVDYVASLGMGMFFTAGKALSLEQKKLILVQPQSLVKEAFLIARLDKYLIMADSLGAAQTILKEAIQVGKD